MPGVMQRWLFNLLLLLTSGLFIAGISAPLFSIEKFWVLKNTVTLLNAIGQMFSQGEWLLAVVISGFSVVVPACKLVLLAIAWNRPALSVRQPRALNAAAALGKWSMLDVFVVAVILVSLKLGPVAQVTVHYGIYLFGASVIVSMLITAFTNKQLTQRARTQSTD